MFNFKNRSSEEFDLICESLPSIEIPQRTVEEIVVDGLDGFLTVQKDFTGMDKQIICHYEGEDFDNLASFLNGSGKVIFSNMPDRYYRAFINNSIPLESIIENRLSKFLINFRCKPFGYLLDNKPISIKNTTRLKNKGTIPSEPIITVTGTGDIQVFITSLDDNNLSQGFVLKGLVANTPVTLDTEKKICYYSTTNWSSKMIGDYPLMPVGRLEISFTGNISNITIIPNWRCLI